MALALVALLASAVPAGAAVTDVTVLGNLLTVKADDADDVITLTVVDGEVAVNGTKTGLIANADAEIVVESGGGNDTADATALVGGNYKSLVLSGQDGDDTLRGGAVNGDVLNGDLGNDTLVGGRGSDTANGGDGDDLMVWNNGDGSDVNNGDLGNDTVQSNGADAINGATGNEAYTYKPGAVADRVQFNRLANAQGLGAFGIDLSAENLVINSLGGEDTFVAPEPGLAGRTLITVNAGNGIDTVNGGDGNDTLNGDAGNDTLTGAKGADTANGGADDDLMVWNNGDGSDVNNGGDGVDTVISNGAVLGETYTYEAAAGRVLFKRIAGAPGFTIDFTAESLLVNSIDGDDKFEQVGADPLAQLTAITVNAGVGNDEVKGSDGADALNGDEGNDLLVGAKGADTANGGDGDDLMVWNNGDGSDVNNGDLGNDTVQSNGNDNNESYTYKPGADAGRVLFERAANAQGAGAFAIDLSAENLVVNSLKGDDTFRATAAGLAGRTLITVNAGEGNDDVEGGDGADTLNGDAGNDRLVGAKGADTANGGSDNDLMVWNNGDGSDVNDGGDGNDTVQSNGADAADETYTYEAVAGRVLFKRVAGAPAFTIDFTAESLLVNALGGNDTVDPLGPLGGLATVVINGGAGNDRAVGNDGNDALDGGAGDDTLFGGLGNDTAVGGAGSDLIDGQGGNDGLQARDQENDLVRGGAGNDTAVTDALTVDSVTGVETLDAVPAPPGPPAPPAPPAGDNVALPPAIGKVTVAASGGKLVAKVPVSCSANEAGGCRTTLTVETAKAARFGGVRAIVVLGSKTVQVAGGSRATASIRIARGAAELAVNGKLAVRVRIVSTDAAGNTVTRTIPMTLKVPRS